MNWRAILGAVESAAPSHAHITQNPQNPAAPTNSAYCADSAQGDDGEDRSRLLEQLAEPCEGLAIAPVEVLDALAPSDINDWRGGHVSLGTLRAFAHALVQRRDIEQGVRPEGFTERANCRGCGPVWLWLEGTVDGCPWCFNRAKGLRIPRPVPVTCGTCFHFRRIDHPHLGTCAAGERLDYAGLWDTDRRTCPRWIPQERQLGVE